MVRTIKGLMVGAAFAAYAGAGVAAFAQAPPPPMSMPGMAGAGPGADKMAEQVARLRDLLQLRPAQEPALQAFASALAAAHQGMMPDMGGQAAPATTPERLARMEQMMARHESAMRAMMDATRRFYAQLDPGQKRAFDALPSMLGGRMMMAGPMRGSGDHMSERMEDGPPGPPR